MKQRKKVTIADPSANGRNKFQSRSKTGCKEKKLREILGNKEKQEKFGDKQEKKYRQTDRQTDRQTYYSCSWS